MTRYAHLGVFSDLVDAAAQNQPLFPPALPGPETIRAVRETLGFANLPEEPRDIHTGQMWERDGVAGEVIR